MTDLDAFRQAKDDFFGRSPDSPLTPEQRRAFTGLRYFPADPGLRFEVEVDRFADGEIIRMQTSTGDIQEYERFGRFTFTVDDQRASLTIYRNEFGYFLPFVDGLAGKESYGAGRYLEPEELPEGRFIIDFNLAYNPYCAYNENWSCPITPVENRVKAAIRAGEKMFEKEA